MSRRWPLWCWLTLMTACTGIAPFALTQDPPGDAGPTVETDAPNEDVTPGDEPDPADPLDSDTTSADDTGAPGDTDEAPRCGNDRAESGEDCDGTDLRGETCSDYDFLRGTLTCRFCAVSVSGCTNEGVCGDGIREGTEGCDGTDFGGATCGTLGFTAGSLACTSACSVDQSACYQAPTCGDGVRNGSEACDGSDLGGATCATFGFDSGNVGCTSGCAIDKSACFDAPVCGDGVRNGSEACDGTALGGATCTSLGFLRGTLGCTRACAHDTSACDDSAVCGDGVRTAPEACDGSDLGPATCPSLGFYDGTVSCSGACKHDTSACRVLSPGGTWCNSNTLTIPTYTATVESTIQVPDVGPVNKVRVSVQGEHEWIGDLDLYLVHAGTTRHLGDPDWDWSYCDDQGTINVRYDDGFSTDPSLCDTASNYLGDRKPVQSLSAFAGKAMDGAWKLRVVDSGDRDGGTITNWCVTINP